MFKLLKKKLKDAIDKISQKGKEKEEEKTEEVIEGQEKKKEVGEKKKKPRTERKAKTKKTEKKEEKKEGLVKKIVKKVSKKIEISEDDIKDVLWDIQISLLEADVAFEATEKIVEDVKNSLIGKKIEKKNLKEEVEDAFKEAILKILSIQQIDFLKEVEKKKPYVILFLGFNGAGKTTTIAKIGKMLKDRGKKVVFAAGDTFRAASIEQLEIHGKNLGIHVIKHSYGSDPAAVIFDAIKHAEAKGIDVVLADTAGRTHVNTNLMEELKKIVRVNKPDMKILVIDSLTGNDVIEQVKLFDENVGIDGIVMTKVDVYEKGGSIISAVFASQKPILFITTGQEYDDIEVFDREKFVDKLFED